MSHCLTPTKVAPFPSDYFSVGLFRSLSSAAGYLMLTNMPQAAASAAPVKTTTGFSQNVLP